MEGFEGTAIVGGVGEDGALLEEAIGAAPLAAGDEAGDGEDGIACGVGGEEGWVGGGKGLGGEGGVGRRGGDCGVQVMHGGGSWENGGPGVAWGRTECGVVLERGEEEVEVAVDDGAKAAANDVVGGRGGAERTGEDGIAAGGDEGEGTAALKGRRPALGGATRVKPPTSRAFAGSRENRRPPLRSVTLAYAM